MTNHQAANWSDSSTDPMCPPTPRDVPAAVEAAAAGQEELRKTLLRREHTSTAHAAYEQLTAEYEQRLADAASDRARLQEEMCAFGAYLRENGVPPEHIVPCVRAALVHVRASRHLSGEARFGRDVVTWAIEGYYRLG
jgi:hypothetical protein